jgi:hypothetical protein
MTFCLVVAMRERAFICSLSFGNAVNYSAGCTNLFHFDVDKKAEACMPANARLPYPGKFRWQKNRFLLIL